MMRSLDQVLASLDSLVIARAEVLRVAPPRMLPFASAVLTAAERLQLRASPKAWQGSRLAKYNAEWDVRLREYVDAIEKFSKAGQADGKPWWRLRAWKHVERV